MTSETIHSEGGAACIVVTPIGDAGRVNVVAKGYMRVSATFDRASAARLAGAIFTAAGIRYVLAGSGVDSSSWTGARQVPEAEGFDYGAVRGTVGFIEAFQRAMGLRIDGIVGPETIAALKRLAEGHADRPASAGDIDVAVDRIISGITADRMKVSALAADLRRTEADNAALEQQRDQARAEMEREKAARANLLTRLDKVEREWRAEEAARRAIQEERGRLTVEARERQRILEQTEAERDQARQQRDDYKRRLDAFGVRGDKPYLYQGQIGDVALIPGGHWRIAYVRATSSGEYRIEMEPVDG